MVCQMPLIELGSDSLQSQDQAGERSDGTRSPRSATAAEQPVVCGSCASRAATLPVTLPTAFLMLDQTEQAKPNNP